MKVLPTNTKSNSEKVQNLFEMIGELGEFVCSSGREIEISKDEKELYSDKITFKNEENTSLGNIKRAYTFAKLRDNCYFFTTNGVDYVNVEDLSGSSARVLADILKDVNKDYQNPYKVRAILKRKNGDNADKASREHGAQLKLNF